VTACNICKAELGSPIYTSHGHGSMTTMLKLYDAPTVVSFCDHCGHLQTKEIVDSAEYYAHTYSLLTATDDEDLLYKVVDGRPIFQVEHRVATMLSKVELPVGAKVLDFGCAKGSVLRRLHQLRSDISPHFFDVTDRYVRFWREISEPSQWAVGVTPPDWAERFDVVCSFYVLEHVADPVDSVTSVTRLIKPGGYFYAIVPNVLANTADFIVADHNQHFTENSWHETLRRAGLTIVDIDDGAHDAGILVIGRKDEEFSNAALPRHTTVELREKFVAMAQFWSKLAARVRSFEQTTGADRDACIYGAGFYGNFIASCLDRPSGITSFVDQNPHLIGRSMLGKPIVQPQELRRDVDVVYAALNPSIAREVIAEIACWRERSMDVFYL
jgi:2-polyprenyl-3-methyl-5-hydroxy-6-metoxy-1,4-benzoquinol methylase